MKAESPPVTNGRYAKPSSAPKFVGPELPPEEDEEPEPETYFGLDCDPDAEESAGEFSELEEESEAFEVPESSESEVSMASAGLKKDPELAQCAQPPIPTPARSLVLGKTTFLPSNAGPGLPCESLQPT